ncbi:MAG TPA: alpha/beta fold hydrolase [Kofleriaceae bacterium]|nr:alpha/beta fold hydrolase [Kofleriaceae bacterium]
MKLVTLLGSLALLGTPAHAGLNDPRCTPSPEHPVPVVLVHGQGGTIDTFVQLGVVDALTAQGYCTYGTNYGADESGLNGRTHLATSADQILAFIDGVRAQTGAAQVDIVAHSAGTGVIDNLVLAEHRGDRIRRVVSFGGLHHPYAHLGDASLFLPNLVAAAQRVNPQITFQQVITDALARFHGPDGTLLGIDTSLAESDFVADLFDPSYWAALHGRLSEPPFRFIVVGVNARTLATDDAVASICYTNIVGTGDPLTGTSAGFQDAADNVANVLIRSSADHVQLLADPEARAAMLGALNTPCAVAPGDRAGDRGDPGDPGATAASADPGEPGGCSSSRSSSLALALAALVPAVVRRRRPKGRP